MKEHKRLTQLKRFFRIKTEHIPYGINVIRKGLVKRMPIILTLVFIVAMSLITVGLWSTIGLACKKKTTLASFVEIIANELGHTLSSDAELIYLLEASSAEKTRLIDNELLSNSPNLQRIYACLVL